MQLFQYHKDIRRVIFLKYWRQKSSFSMWFYDQNLTRTLWIQDVLEIQTSGPYNIVGDSWGGALALTVGQLLEARGHKVNLILIQGIPTIAQNRLKDLCRRFDADLGTCILNVALNTQAKVGESIYYKYGFKIQIF